MSIHDKIIDELFTEFKDNPILESNDIIDLHFGLGRYIRNKYIWHNKENYEYFIAFYNVTCADDISDCIIKELKQLKILQKNHHFQ